VSRDTPARLLREAIAQAAARLIAEDGINDFALAKRKAARQMGVQAQHHLPDNESIEEALRAYREVFQTASHPQLLRELRDTAYRVMLELEDYTPQLTGSVLQGTAGAESDINLLLFADSSKDVEIDLINRGIPFEAGERRRQWRGISRAVPVLSVFVDDRVVNLEILEPRDRHDRPRNSGSRSERLDARGLAQLLEQPDEDLPEGV